MVQPGYLQRGTLRDYQLQGLNWLVYSWSRNENCILADEVRERVLSFFSDEIVFSHFLFLFFSFPLTTLSLPFLFRPPPSLSLSLHKTLLLQMGLGKTVQCVSMLGYLRDQLLIGGPFLVVVPLSTVPNWAHELKKWLPSANSVVYVGDNKSREVIRRFEFGEGFADGGAGGGGGGGGRRKKGAPPSSSSAQSRRSTLRAPRTTRFDVLVTTYELVLKDAALLNRVKWNYLVVDEAHRLKNSAAALYKGLSAMKFANKLLVTGTPLQNSLRELWALLHFLDPAKFPDSAEFEREYEVKEAEQVLKLHEQLRPHLLRRVIKDVEKSLPPKNERILRVGMTPLQKRYYRWILTRNFRDLNKGARGGAQVSLLNIITVSRFGVFEKGEKMRFFFLLVLFGVEVGRSERRRGGEGGGKSKEKENSLSLFFSSSFSSPTPPHPPPTLTGAQEVLQPPVPVRVRRGRVPAQGRGRGRRENRRRAHGGRGAPGRGARRLRRGLHLRRGRACPPLRQKGRARRRGSLSADRRRRGPGRAARGGRPPRPHLGQDGPSGQAAHEAQGDGPPCADLLADGARARHHRGLRQAARVPVPEAGRVDAGRGEAPGTIVFF